jgi:hypothetical protein
MMTAFIMATWFPANANTVGKYRLFEAQVINDKAYENKFADVELLVDYTAPSGKTWNFWGFYDGNGTGGGDKSAGNVWKMRFMPDEIGTWRYRYRWSDGTKGGSGSFESTTENAGKGIIKAYGENPHWFAYNGTDPVWLKSYYETGHSGIAQDFDWVSDNVFQPLVDNGYNHLQVNWLMSLCCYSQYYRDGPEPSTLDLTLYESGKASSTMNLYVWKLMEMRMAWLNDRDVGVHMFLGFDGSRNGGPKWEDLTESEKVFYVKYSVARLGAYANLAGWNFVWEVEGGRETHELGLAKLLAKYDIFDHLRTYEDETPREHHFDEEAYTFAAVENHEIITPNRAGERYNYWRTAWTHYRASLLGYVGKPVYMAEGNSLWRRYWHERAGATQEDLRQAAWATTMAGASFNWNGHSSENNLYAGGPTGLPFNEINEYHLSERYIEILTRIMNEKVAFHKLTPQSDQLTAHDPFRVFALIEEGQQSVVFSIKGDPFSLFVAEGDYTNNVWIDTKTGQEQTAPNVTGLGALEVKPRGYRSRESWPTPLSFTPPSTDTDWLLILRK